MQWWRLKMNVAVVAMQLQQQQLLLLTMLLLLLLLVFILNTITWPPIKMVEVRGLGFGVQGLGF